jgi:GTPase-associated protein 1, N-terminal domain type 1/Effector-associated domain 1
MKPSSENLSDYPLRASYGDKNNSHDLLAFNGDPAKLPAILAGLTDKPPGHVAPHERWWPAVGCGPMGEWWALWWTMPDEKKGGRGGMVKSEVALWPIELAAQIHNFGEIMQQLNGGTSIVPPTGDLLKATVIALLDQKTQPPVVTDLDAWPGLLVALWEQLWPEARKCFAARVAITPPQNGESVSPPWLYAMAQGQENKWPPTSIITDKGNIKSLNRAAKLLIGEADSITTELLIECPLHGEFPTELNRLGRVADNLAAIRLQADTAIAIQTFRTLAALAPRATQALPQKQEVLTMLKIGLGKSPPELLLALRNFTISAYPPASMPSNEVQRWVFSELPTFANESTSSFLEAFATGVAQEPEHWWFSAVRDGLMRGLQSKQNGWFKLLFAWLGQTEKSALIREVILSAPHSETMVLEVAQQNNHTNMPFELLCRNSQTLAWPRLHAWGLLQSMLAQEAFLAQLAFKPDAEPGLVFLVEELAGSDLITAVIALNNNRLLELSARRTAADLALLTQLDLNSAAWRSLWAFHIHAGGHPWPADIDRGPEMVKFLVAANNGKHPTGIIAKLATDFAKIALQFTERTKLWKKLSPADANALALQTACTMLEECKQGNHFDPPEPFLRDAVFQRADENALSANIIILLIGWDSGLQEARAQRWIENIQDWRYGSESLGRLISERAWGSAAKDLFQRFYWRGEGSVLPALKECRNQLNWLDNFWLSYKIPNESKSLQRDKLIKMVAYLGARYEPDRLNVIWEKAGGKLGRLESAGSHEDRWFAAAKKADAGALAGGLLSLVNVLREDLPKNSEIKELHEILKAK